MRRNLRAESNVASPLGRPFTASNECERRIFRAFLRLAVAAVGLAEALERKDERMKDCGREIVCERVSVHFGGVYFLKSRIASLERAKVS